MFKEVDCHSFKSTHNLNEVFHSAIKNLEHFTAQNKSKTVPHVLNLDVRDSAIITKSNSFFKRIWNVLRYFFGSLLSTRLRKKFEQRRTNVQEEILRSIATVKKHYLIIDRFKEGSTEQQKIAALTQEVIERYNAIIQQSQQQLPSFREHLIKFVYDRMGVTLGGALKNTTIELPIQISVQSNSPHFHEKKITQRIAPTSAIASKKVAELATVFNQKLRPACQLTQQELDAFCMKAITMIKNHAIPITSIREALNFVKTQPIVATYDLADGVEGETPSSIVSLSQTLSLFPGEMIELIGAFKRNSQSHVISTPIADRFQLSSKSVQSGFPHPSQHHGWALSDKLIPVCPLRMDRMPHLKALQTQKKMIALELLPSGHLIGKAKQILKFKRQAFEEQKRLFLSMHKALNRSIFRAAFKEESLSSELFRPIDSYFSLLVEQPASFENLSKTIHLFNEQFLEMPFNKLEEAWMDGTNADLSQPDLQLRFMASEKILMDEINKGKEELLSRLGQLTSEFERATIEYLVSMAEVITPATNAIILQQFSEKIEFVPPTLNNFAQLLQAILYRQAIEFHNELSMEFQPEASANVIQMQQHLKKLLEMDLALFKTVDVEDLPIEQTAIVHELEDYYNLHFSLEIKPLANFKNI